ncbi:MAG: hypothetical protein ABI877_12090 [Gemmatimonadaceae bacterium]
MRSISYRGLQFSSPMSYWDENLHFYLPDSPGVYAILVRREALAPWLEPIHFGETHSFRDRHVGGHHECIPQWLAHPGARSLLISYCELPESSKAVREYMLGLLISHFKPVCNLAHSAFDRGVSPADLLRGPVERDQFPPDPVTELVADTQSLTMSANTIRARF